MRDTQKDLVNHNFEVLLGGWNKGLRLFLYTHLPARTEDKFPEDVFIVVSAALFALFVLMRARGE